MQHLEVSGAVRHIYEGDPKSKVSIMLGLQGNCSRDCYEELGLQFNCSQLCVDVKFKQKASHFDDINCANINPMGLDFFFNFSTFCI